MPTMTKKRRATKVTKKKKKAKKKTVEYRCEKCCLTYPKNRIVTRDGVDKCQWCVCGLVPPGLREEERQEAPVRDWYAVAVGSGKLPDKVVIDEETGKPMIVNKNMADAVRDRLMKKARIEGIYPSMLGRIIVPTAKQIVLKKGKRVVQNKKAMFNYIAVQCVMDGDMIHMIQAIPGVIGILPLRPQLKGFRYPRKEPRQARKVKQWEIEQAEAWQPVPMTPDEVDRLLQAEKEKKSAPKPVKLPFKVDDAVKVKGGAWKGSKGLVLEIVGPAFDPFVKVEVTMLGRKIGVDILWRDLERSK